MSGFSRTVIAAALIAAATAAHAQDWPQFRGPTGQGHSTEPSLPFDWSESHNIA